MGGSRSGLFWLFDNIALQRQGGRQLLDGRWLLGPRQSGGRQEQVLGDRLPDLGGADGGP